MSNKIWCYPVLTEDGKIKEFKKGEIFQPYNELIKENKIKIILDPKLLSDLNFEAETYKFMKVYYKIFLEGICGLKSNIEKFCKNYFIKEFPFEEVIEDVISFSFQSGNRTNFFSEKFIKVFHHLFVKVALKEKNIRDFECLMLNYSMNDNEYFLYEGFLINTLPITKNLLKSEFDFNLTYQFFNNEELLEQYIKVFLDVEKNIDYHNIYLSESNIIIPFGDRVKTFFKVVKKIILELEDKIKSCSNKNIVKNIYSINVIKFISNIYFLSLNWDEINLVEKLKIIFYLEKYDFIKIFIIKNETIHFFDNSLINFQDDLINSIVKIYNLEKYKREYKFQFFEMLKHDMFHKFDDLKTPTNEDIKNLDKIFFDFVGKKFDFYIQNLLKNF